jgi:hypothetical protein
MAPLIRQPMREKPRACLKLLPVDTNLTFRVSNAVPYPEPVLKPRREETPCNGCRGFHFGEAGQERTDQGVRVSMGVPPYHRVRVLLALKGEQDREFEALGKPWPYLPVLP